MRELVRRWPASVCLILTAWSVVSPAFSAPFNVPALPLDQALREIARQGHVQILFSGAMTSRLTSAPVEGHFDVMSAYCRALARTGLEARRVDGGTLIIARSETRQDRRGTKAPACSSALAAPVLPARVQEAEETAPPITEVVVTARRPSFEAPGSADGVPAGNAYSLSRAETRQRVSQNISETLGTIPGMTVLNTGRSFIGGIDSASRGEGMFTAFRGLDTEFNLTMMNGVALAQGLPYSRGVQLNLLPADSFQTVTVYKSGQADQDGDVIGAAIDFTTPKAADFSGGHYTALNLSGRLNTRAGDYGDTAFGGGASFELARTRDAFGGRLGIYLSSSYERHPYTNSELAGIMGAQNDNGWAYAVAADSEGHAVNPARPEDNLTLTSLNAGVSTGTSTSWFHSLALDWRGADDLRLYLHATAARADTEQNSTFSQIVSTGNTYAKGDDGLYHLSVNGLSTRVWYETNPDRITQSAVKFGAEKTWAGWRFSPSLFYSHSGSARPNHIEASARIDQNDAYNQGNSARAFSGLLVTYENGLPVPNLTQAVYNDLNTAGATLLARRAGQLTVQYSEQDRYGAAFDTLFAPQATDAPLIGFGVKISRSARDVTSRDWTNDYYGNLLAQAGVTWDNLGFVGGTYSSVFPGLYNWSLPKVNHDSLVANFYKYLSDASFDTCGSLYLNNLNCNTQKGTEDVDAAYVTARFYHDRWDMTTGLRFEHTDIRNTFWVLPVTDDTDALGHWAESRTRYDKLLPSLTLNFRPNTRSLWRAAVWRSYNRPAFLQLGGGVRIETDASGVTTITRGNPDLKPVDASNLDLSVQTQITPDATLTLSAYAKQLDHYLYEAGSTISGDTVSDDAISKIVTPRNGGRGFVSGLETQWRAVWPAPFDPGGRLSLDLNLSRQFTHVDLGSDSLGHNMPMQSAPNWLGNLVLGYSRNAEAIYVSCNHTGAYLSEYDSLGVDGTWDNTWVRPLTRCDLRAWRRLSAHSRLDLSVSNLGGAYSYWAHVGKHSLALSDIVDSGRRIVLSLKYSY
ncbi:MAG: TonB-dependent receptor [Asticcacaulis sp.]|uniref:TonB-dependent receptor n=1 Tax=Asticcacaulis sp. TaxID=1872648 RepID=UPI0039E4B3A7